LVVIEHVLFGPLQGSDALMQAAVFLEDIFCSADRRILGDGVKEIVDFLVEGFGL
jgi:hypothetical protein